MNPITVASVATALPEHTITDADVKRYFKHVFSIPEDRLRVMMTVVDNAQIDRRFCVNDIDTIIEPRPISELSCEYQKHSIRLGHEAAVAALDEAGIEPRDVDVVITVSCTGFMIPSLDAHLINMLGMRSNVKRLPVTELGCAAGAAMLARASDFLRDTEDKTVLVVSVEIPSLTFQRGDLSPANLISSILFGDGAAAAVVTTRPAQGPRILETESYLFPDSIGAMGFDLKNSGFHIVLSRDVPDLIRSRIRGLVDRFLENKGLSRQTVPAFVLHPGGQKLLSFVEEELELPRSATQASWDILREFGNLSSASVLFVLDRWMRQGNVEAGKHGLLAAFGPGFSAEMLLLEWT